MQHVIEIAKPDRYLHEMGHMQSAKELASAALSLCGDQHPCNDSRAIIIDSLGSIAASANDGASCFRLLSEFFSMCEKGILSNFQTYAYTQKGCALMMSRQYEEALQYCQKAVYRLEQSEQLGQHDYHHTASLEFANLGFNFWILGRLSEAKRVLEQGIQRRQELFGKNDTKSSR